MLSNWTHNKRWTSPQSGSSKAERSGDAAARLAAEMEQEVNRSRCQMNERQMCYGEECICTGEEES